MYRCYLIRNGCIAWGEYLDCNTTEEAKILGHTLWDSHPQSDSFDGIEVWHGQSFVYSDGMCPTVQTVSPFDTPESTIYPTWRPTTARPIGMLVMCGPCSGQAGE
jgi:hypothetical protein